MHWHEKYKVNLPAASKGPWRVEPFEVPERSLEGLRAAMAGRPIPPGKYTRLMRGAQLVMSDTPAEIGDHLEFIRQARGRVLIAALGLGVVLGAVLAKPEVARVDVVEASKEVLELIGPFHACDRVKYHRADIFRWRPPKGARWDAAWFDVWDDICQDNAKGMERLRERFGRLCKWSGCWSEDQMR